MQIKIKRQVFPRVQKFLLIMLISIIMFVSIKGILWGMKFSKETGLTAMTLLKLTFNTGVSLPSDKGRTNVLFLGISGGKHAGADLTDTIIVASIQPISHRLAFISIPRDVWSDTLKDKVNSAYHYGEEKKIGGGKILAKAIIEDIIGMPIHYAFIVDFTGFKDMIDLVGGIDITVERTFTDNKFPIDGREEDECGGDKTLACRYETLHFEAGITHMDGIKALRFVRSRSAEGNEGNDFARSRRQQDVLIALKKKALSFDFLKSPGRLSGLTQALDRATETDMNIGELATIGKIVSSIPNEATEQISIEDLLTNPPLWQYGRYVLIPKEDFAAIHKFLQQKLTK